MSTKTNRVLQKPPPDIVAYLNTPLQEGATVSVNAFGSLTPPPWYAWISTVCCRT